MYGCFSTRAPQRGRTFLCTVSRPTVRWKIGFIFNFVSESLKKNTGSIDVSFINLLLQMRTGEPGGSISAASGSNKLIQEKCSRHSHPESLNEFKAYYFN